MSALGAQRGDAPSRVVVVVPCLDEAATIARVVRDFARALPEAEIAVFDNASSDATAEEARRAGARVVQSPRRGKGNVLRHMAREIDADWYVVVDGDATYPAEAAPALLERARRGDVDMVVATRLGDAEAGAFRVFHRFGNRLVARLISVLFRAEVTDVLSGYRVLSRDLVRLVQLSSEGFEVETELTLQALTKGFAVAEVPVAYAARPAGSASKLSTFSDGFLILRSAFLIFKDYKPLPFFGALALLLAVGSVVSGIGPVMDFVQTGLVYRVPRAILAVGLGVLATLSLGIGLILDTISKYHRETIELWKRHLRE